MNFKDSDNFVFKNNKVYFKTDCSSWVKVALNNYPLDDYLFHQFNDPNPVFNIGIKENKGKEINHTEIKSPKNRLRTKRKKNLYKMKKTSFLYQDDFIDNTNICWTHK